MKLSDAKAFFKCLSFDGGMRASCVLLLQENGVAQELFDVCKRVKYDTDGILKVHHISWNADASGDDIEH